MKKQNGLLLILASIFIITACKKSKQGVLEVKATTNSQIDPNGSKTFYYTLIVEDDLYEENKEFTYKTVNTNVEKHTGYYWSNKSSKELGYKYKCKTEELRFYKAKDCDSYGGPGENGHWKDNSKSSNQTGGGGNCSGGYVKIGDPQLDGLCGQAYAYRCLDGKPLSDPQVQAACKVYNQMKEPSVPDCPYCK